jgi:hypothetical protein
VNRTDPISSQRYGPALVIPSSSNSIGFMINAVNDNYFRRSKVTAFIRRPPDRAGKRHSCSARFCWISPGLVSCAQRLVVFPRLEPITDSV